VRNLSNNIRIKVKVLSDPLIRIVGIEETDIVVNKGRFSLNELINTLKSLIPNLEKVFQTRRLGREVFIAVNGQVIYDLNKVVELGGESRISIFTLGAGG